MPIFVAPVIEANNMEVYSDEDSPRPKSIHVIMRPEKDGQVVKLTETEKKNMKKQLKQACFQDFPEDEDRFFFEDSKAAQLAAAGSSKQTTKKEKKEKKDKVVDIEE